MGQRSKAVLISVLIAGLLLGALLIAGYFLKSRQEQTKGLRLVSVTLCASKMTELN